MTKSVRLTADQENYIERTNLNFSEWVRDQLTKKMEREYYSDCIICDTPVYVSAGHDVSPGTPLGTVMGLAHMDDQDDTPLAACETHYNQALKLLENPDATPFPEDFVPDDWTQRPSTELATLDRDGEGTPHRQYEGTHINGWDMVVSLETYGDPDKWIVFAQLNPGTPNEDLYHDTFTRRPQAIGTLLQHLRHNGATLPKPYQDN